jgi:hypothetical protein
MVATASIVGALPEHRVLGFIAKARGLQREFIGLQLLLITVPVP